MRDRRSRGDPLATPVRGACFDPSAPAPRPAGRAPGGCTRLDRDQKPVGEREEGVGRYDGSLTERRRETGVVRGVRSLARSDTGRIDPAHLAGPDPDRGAILGIYYSVRFHVLGDPKREPQIG